MYGIIFIVLAIVLFPHTYITVMSYFFFVSLIGSFAGYAFNKLLIVFIANCAGLVFILSAAIGILASSWVYSA